VTELRWLIQTVCSSGSPSKSAPSFASSAVLPNSEDLRALHPTAEELRLELHAVADAERRDAQPQQLGIHLRGVLGEDRRRPTGEDQRMRVAGANLSRGDVVRDELGEDTAVAHAAGDQLCVLAAEVEDEHRPLLRLGRRERNDLVLQLGR